MNRDSPLITRALLEAILVQYRLHPGGPHGLAHWARVLENGRRLARSTGASRPVVELFAVFHDACRENDGRDPDHGARGALLVEELRGRLFDLPDEDFVMLRSACSDHTNGRTDGEITVRTCWDADRLDLGRVGITPRARYLCTEPARRREMIAWADGRARSAHVPKLLGREWRLRADGSFLP